MTTREQRNAYIRDNKDEINREFGPLAILVFLNFALTAGSLIAWGFGAPNMLWVALILAALTIHLFITFRKRVREHVDQRLSETR